MNSETQQIVHPSQVSPQKRKKFEEAVVIVFQKTFGLQFDSFKSLILFEKKQNLKSSRHNVWQQIGELCGLSSQQTNKFYQNTWIKYYLDPWDFKLRNQVLENVSELTARRMLESKCALPIDQHKDLIADVVREILNKFKIKDYENCHFETMYHAAYSKAANLVKIIFRDGKIPLNKCGNVTSIQNVTQQNSSIQTLKNAYPTKSDSNDNENRELEILQLLLLTQLRTSE